MSPTIAECLEHAEFVQFDGNSSGRGVWSGAVHATRPPASLRLASEHVPWATD
jgi:hypothetical protein